MLDFVAQRMKRCITTLVCFLLLGSVVEAHAEKIAYVDARRLIDQAPQGKLEVSKLEEAFSVRNRELRSKFELFRSQKSEFEKNSVLMSTEEAEEKAKGLRYLQRDLEREQQQYNEDYAEVRNEGLARLENMISRVIVQIAQKDNIDLVLQQVVYASEKINLTDDVLKELEKQFNQ